MPGTERIIEQKYLQKSITYDAYKQLVENYPCARRKSHRATTVGSNGPLLAAQCTADASCREDDGDMPEVKEQLIGVNRPQTWLVLSEGSCGDAAKTVPVMKALADLNPNMGLVFCCAMRIRS